MDVEHIHLVQVEMFYLAQVVAYSAAPALQRALDTSRREVVQALSDYEDKTPDCDPAFFRPSLVKSNRWTDFQITPELTLNPALTGIAVPRELANRLVRLHREQIRVVSNLIHG